LLPLVEAVAVEKPQPEPEMVAQAMEAVEEVAEAAEVAEEVAEEEEMQHPTQHPTQQPAVEGKVLALLEVNASKRVSICQLKSDSKVECENDISSGANATLSYIHEFDNGKVLLRDSNNKLYFFDGNQVTKLTTYKALDSADETTTSAGINALTGSSVGWYATKNFVIMYDSSSQALVAVSKEGKVIRDSGISSNNINIPCEAATKSGNTYKLNADGSISTTTTIPASSDILASAGGKHVVKNSNNNKIYLSNSRCSTSGATELPDAPSSPNDAKMVLDGNGNFYIAVRHGNTNLKYYKVSDDTASEITLSTSPTVPNDKYSYALDGEGRLYAINNSAPNPVLVYRTNGTELNNRAVVSANYTKLLGFKDRVLGIDDASTPNVYQIYQDGSTVVNSSVSSISHASLTACTHATNTRANDGMGTNFNRCAANNRLYVFKYDSGSERFSEASFTVAISSERDVKWDTYKVLVKPSSDSIKLCSTTTDPSISCSATDLPHLDTTRIDQYLKSDGRNKVLYTSGSGAKLGDIFDLSTFVSIPASGMSGGGASFDLTKFAYITGSGSCLTSIAYLSSPTASPKTYTIEQPSGACVKGILKVY
jgi:hypothetical protein